MSKSPLLLIGAGGHARSCIDVIEEEGKFSILGLVGTPEQVGNTLLGYPILGTDEDIPRLARACPYALVTVGQIKSPRRRMALFDQLLQLWCSMPVIVSPRAHVSRHAVVSSGTVVMHGAIVNAGAKVGRNCILNSQCLIEHDATIGDHCHIATCASLNSAVQVGAGTFIGSHAAVRQGVRIGERCVIGMGVVVLGDCTSDLQLPTARIRPL